MTTAIAAIFVVLGGFFTILAGVGILRLRDVFLRMHAATKVGTLGSGLILIGVCVHFGDPAVVLRSILIFLFLMLTSPIGAHMIGRAALRIGIDPRGGTPDGTPPEQGKAD